MVNKIKKLIFVVFLGFLLGSCEDNIFEDGYQFEYPEMNYEFKMTGRSYQDLNGYYHLQINPSENQQTSHRFGAYITNIDKYGLPAQVIWRCDAFWYTPDTLGYTYIEIGNVPTGESPWSWENFAVTGYEGMTMPIVNGTSFADPQMDSVFCIMSPIGAMIGDTVTIYGRAYFEEGGVLLEDNINVIFE